MNTKIIRTLVKKELLDVLRDKKTVIMMFVVPIIVYPLIFVVAMQVMFAVSAGMEQQSYRIAIGTGNGRLQQRLEQKDTEGDTGDGQSQKAKLLLDGRTIPDYEAALQEKEIDAYVTESMQGGQMQYHIYYLSSSENSSYAAELIKSELETMKEEMARQRIQMAGLDVSSILEPVACKEEDVANSEQSMGSIMGSILPFMLVASLLMGTMYPAIDTTAGERERGTLETMLTLPVTNHQLIVGKFLTVAAIGMVSALLNILSMGGIAFYIYQVLELGSLEGSFDAGVFLPALVVSILAVFAFSMFISAVTMCVTSFARSYKEANNYLTPLMLVVMLTGYIGFIPNVELTRLMSVVPVANICLLIKNLLLFQLNLEAVAFVLTSNIAYAVLAILFLSKIYDSEAVLFEDSKSSFQIFEKRGNLKQGGLPSLSDVWFVLALTTVLVLYAGSLLQMKYGIGGVFGTQMMLLAVPLFVVWYTKKDLRKTYGFQKPALSAYFGGSVLIIGLFFVNLALSYGLSKVFVDSAEQVSNTFSQIMDGGIAVNLLVLAVTPAVCEEMLFRGLFFHSMKAKYKASAAIGITAVLFGAYHMSLVKFIPTGLLGFALCYVVYCTGSIFPAMLMHFLNNALSVILSSYPKQVGKLLPMLYQETWGLSDSMVLAGAGIFLTGVGAAMVRRKRGIV